MSGEPSSLGAVKPRVLALGVPPPARGPSYSSPGPSPAGGLGASQTSQAQGRLEPSADLIIEAQPVLRSLGSKTTFHGRFLTPSQLRGLSCGATTIGPFLNPLSPLGLTLPHSLWLDVSSLRGALGCMQPVDLGTYCTRCKGLSGRLSS